MIRNHLTLSLLFTLHILLGQDKNCDCLDELDKASELIENAKSYKYGIRGKGKETDFGKWKDEIEQEILNDSLSEYFCVGYLQKYISFLRDEHNQIYFVPEKTSMDIPSYSTEIDTTSTGADGISGKYYAGSDVIFLKRESDSLWYGISLESDSDAWTKDKIRLRLHKTADGSFELFEYFANGLLFYQRDIEISDGRIHSTFWNKGNSYFFNKDHKENFTYETISTSFDYIGIKTLGRTTKLIREADRFYERNLGKLTKENIIIDLRNNGGGSLNQAKPLLRSLKRNEAIENIYVLINFKTASSAELMALELKKDKRTILAGENSRGMLTYGYGNRAFSTKTDCFNFQVTLSTERENKEYAKYEGKGIPPDLLLDNNSDWIDQIVHREPLKK